MQFNKLRGYMKLLSKLILPVLALNLVASSAIIAEPKYVYELFTPKQAAVLAATDHWPFWRDGMGHK